MNVCKSCAVLCNVLVLGRKTSFISSLASSYIRSHNTFYEFTEPKISTQSISISSWDHTGRYCLTIILNVRLNAARPSHILAADPHIQCGRHTRALDNEHLVDDERLSGGRSGMWWQISDSMYLLLHLRMNRERLKVRTGFLQEKGYACFAECAASYLVYGHQP